MFFAVPARTITAAAKAEQAIDATCATVRLMTLLCSSSSMIPARPGTRHRRARRSGAGMPQAIGRQRMSNCSHRNRLAGIPSARKPLPSAVIIGGGPHV
jgi:hypothetical protein